MKIKDFKKKIEKFKNLLKLNKNHKKLTIRCFNDLKVIIPDDFGEKMMIEKMKKNMKMSGILNDKHRSEQKSKKIQIKFVKNINKIIWWKEAFDSKIPKYKYLIEIFSSIRDRRKKQKKIYSRIQTNSVTRIRKCSIVFSRKKLAKQIKNSLVLVNFSIFSPIHYGKDLKKEYEFIFKSTDSLIDVHERIPCMKNKLKSNLTGCFFSIENTLYVKNYSVKDVSRIIKKYFLISRRYEKKKIISSDLKSMTVQLEDLILKQGAFYNYVHFGICVHTLIFNWIRQVRLDLKLRFEKLYPLPIFELVHKVQNCGICNFLPAKLVTYNDILTPNNPFFFCKECFINFHFNNQGNLIYKNFKLSQFKL